MSRDDREYQRRRAEQSAPPRAGVKLDGLTDAEFAALQRARQEAGSREVTPHANPDGPPHRRLALPNLHFDPDNHRYQLDGHPVPHVTEILARVVGAGWQADDWYVHRGTAVHAAARLLCEGRLDWASVDPRIEGRVRAVQAFLDDYHVDVSTRRLEMLVASRRYQFAGTLDLYAAGDRMNTGGDIVIDWKGSLCPQARLQLAAYAIAAEETFRVRITTGMVVELHDDASYRVDPIMSKHDLRIASNLFLACLSVYGFIEKHNIKGANANGN